jgi:hypothetical protein
MNDRATCEALAGASILFFIISFMLSGVSSDMRSKTDAKAKVVIDKLVHEGKHPQYLYIDCVDGLEVAINLRAQSDGTPRFLVRKDGSFIGCFR